MALFWLALMLFSIANAGRRGASFTHHHWGNHHRRTFSAIALASPQEYPLEENASSSSKLEFLQSQITSLNGGIPVNVNSPKQVAHAIFGQMQAVNKAALQKAASDDSLDERSQRLAMLVLECRLLNSNNSPDNSPEPVGAVTASTTSSTSRKPSLEEVQRPDFSTSSNEKLVEKEMIDPPPVLRSNDQLSAFEQQIEELFQRPNNLINTYWKDVLRRLTRPSARALVAQLDSEQCPVGYNPLACPFDPLRSAELYPSATTAGKKGSFLAYYREQKEKYSDCVVLTRCGDFYETFGVDAILLVEHCGLNSMGGKAKAGCPIRNIQAVLDCLTSAGFRVAVYEEGTDTDTAGVGASAGSKSRIKNRFLAQIVSSASPTYLYDLLLLGNAADTFETSPLSRPYVGILSSQAGYTMTEISVEERSVRVSTRLTAEAVACRLAAYPPADPLFYVPSPGEYERPTTALPFLPGRMDTSTHGPGARLRTQIIPPNLVQQEGSGIGEVDRAKNVVVSALLQLTERKEDDSPATKRATVDDFTLVSSLADQSAIKATRTESLYVETATQLGLMNDQAIPSLVSYLLPESAPAATRRFLRRLLLTPPPPVVGEAMADLVAFLRREDGPALPPLTIPPVGKVLAMLRAGQASAHVYSELLRAMDATKIVLDILRRENETGVAKSLMTLLEYESGLAADPVSLEQRCDDCMTTIEEVLCPIHHVGGPSEAADDERVTDYGDLIPKAFFERNEAAWRGRVRPDAAPGAYSRVEEAAERLAYAIAGDFWCLELSKVKENMQKRDHFDSGGKNLVVQDIFNNLLALKDVPGKTSGEYQIAEKYFHPRDRHGKIIRNRYTTEAVQSALADYVDACAKSCDDVSAALVRLSEALYDKGHIPAVVQASHANLILSSAFYHAVKSNSLGWNMCNVVEESPDGEQAGHFDELWPYWMNRDEAVANTFDLSGMWVLTAPNMSGKSTIMRSTAAAALLSICGLCAPLKSGIVRRFDHIFVRGASSDVPTEQKSAFGAEMGDVAALLRCCGEKSLVFVDELGRGTSPRDGTRLAAAVLEAMAVSGMSGIFATHLHDIFELPLRANHRIVKKRMAIHDVDGSGHESSRYRWTYRLEDGICTDSMALLTAERFGLPADVIKRAETLGDYLPTRYRASPDLTSSCDQDEQIDSSRRGCLADVTQIAEDTTGLNSTFVPARWNPPPAFCDGKACVYVLRLDTEPPRYYVGETDNFCKRIEQHRSKGKNWSNVEAIVLPAPQGKSQARVFESLLIRRMARAGFAMESIKDGRSLRSSNDCLFVGSRSSTPREIL